MISKNKDRNSGTCPTCGGKFLFSQTPTPPFCSERCQRIDLGKWFNEKHGLPYESVQGVDTDE
jgi:hypothetical protein